MEGQIERKVCGGWQGGVYSKHCMSYIPNILAAEKLERTKYFFINQLVWTSSIFINMSYLSYKQIMSTKAGKLKS